MKIIFNITIVCISLFVIGCFYSKENLLGIQENHEINNSSLGVNLDYLTYYMTSTVFLNIALEGTGWRVANGIELDLDENGWPKSGDHMDQIYKRSLGSYNLGTYVCTWEGEADVHFEWDAKTVLSEDNRIEFEINSTSTSGFVMIVENVNPDDYIKNIKIYEKKYEDIIDKEIFYPEYLEKLKQFNTLRFMEWGRINKTNVVNWEDRIHGKWYNQASEQGVALEYMVKISNLTNTNPWICVPTRASDDYVRNMAKYIKDNLNSNLNLYIEYSNEAWNWSFGQAIYMHQEFSRLGLEKPSGLYQDRLLYYSYRSKQIFDIFEEVYGGTDRFVRTIGGQNAWKTMAYEVLKYQDNYKSFDAVAVAPYFTADKVFTNDYRLDHPEDPTVDEIIQVCKDDLYKSINGMKGHKDLVDEYGLDLLAYEGGHHLVIFNADNWTKEMSDKFLEAAFNQEMESIYKDYLDAWKDAGGGLFVHYKLIDGRWGLFKNMEDESSSKYNAVKNFINENPKWW